MRHFVKAFTAACIIVVACVPVVYAVPGDVVSSVSTPANAPTGLAFDGIHLWVADRLTDTLYAIEPASGVIVQTLPAPGFVPLGMAWDGKYLWCIDGAEARICQSDVATGITRRSLESPTKVPEGLAWDGKYLWICDGTEDVLCQISTEDGTTIKSHRAPSDASSGLTYWNGYLWCADRRDDKIYLFDPAHGEVAFGMDAPGKYARGLAASDSVLWCADYQDDRVYSLVSDDGNAIKLSKPHTLALQLTHEFRNYGPGVVPTLDVYIAVPGDLPNQKLLTPAQFMPEPLEVIQDRWAQPVAHFRMTDLPLSERKRIVMNATAELSEARWFSYPHKVGKLQDMPQDVHELYLGDEDKYRINDPGIQDAVRTAVGKETNPYWMMRSIHRHIREHLRYELAGGWNVAPHVLQRGTGSCSEYTFLFISMCRAAGIPARYVGSVVIRGDEASSDEVFHRWSQVYLPNYGWVHVDPQGGDREKPAEVAASIGLVGNQFLITTAGGGASEYLDWNYNYQEKWTGKGPVKIHTEAVGEWSPVDSTKTISGSKIETGAGCKVN